MPGSPTTRGRSGAFRKTELRQRPGLDFFGTDGHRWPPPAQIRAGAANALGSYLECVTRNRASGHGGVRAGTVGNT
jgi:hypothetical protein